MPENSNTLPSEQRPWPNQTVKRLAVLVGTWDIEVVLAPDQPTIKGGQATFEWLEEGYFLIGRTYAGRADFPKGFTVMGSDDTLESHTMLYYDSRGVSRVYQMSLDDTTWKLWRDAPGFSQRFTGEFHDDGNTIQAMWEKSEDGTTWELDFHLTYTKVNSKGK